MFFNKQNPDDPYGDLRRREEYEREQKLHMARTGGNLFANLMGYWFVWLFTGAFSATILQKIFDISDGLTLLFGLVGSFIIFKVPYVKQHPYKSFIVICFVFGLFIIASS